MVVSSLLGILIGIILGVTGAGGGILAVPALVFGMGWSMQSAAPVALIAVATGAAFGTLQGLRAGQVRYRAAFLMSAAGFPLVFAGQDLARVLPQAWLVVIFSAVMATVALRLLWMGPAHELAAHHGGLQAHIDDTGRIRWTWPVALLIAGIGAAAGLMTGLLGVGGGFVIVPLLHRFTQVKVHHVVATSLMVVAMASCGGVVTAVLQGHQLPWPETLWFALSTTLGMAAGRQVSAHLSPAMVRQGFAILLLVVAAMLVIRTI